MTRVKCNPWKRTFTLAPLVLLTVISPQWLQLFKNSLGIIIH